MSRVDVKIADVVYSSSVSPDIKFHLEIFSYNGSNITGTNNEQSYINGYIDNVCVASDCLTAANQIQANHVALREKSQWVTSGDNYRMIEFLAAVCESVSLENTETENKDKSNADITVREFFTKEADSNVVNYSVFAEGMCVYKDTYQLVYDKTTTYPDNNLKIDCVKNPSVMPDFDGIKRDIAAAIANNTIVRQIVVPDNETKTYTTQQYSYKYFSEWHVMSEEADNAWHTTVGFDIKYGTDTADSQTFVQKQYTFDHTTFHNADAVLRTAYNDALNDLKDRLDIESGVKLMTSSYVEDFWLTDPKTISDDKYEQTTAYSRSHNTNELVLEATGTVDNYDSSVISLLSFEDGTLQDRAGLAWTANGAATTTTSHSRFSQGLRISSKAYLISAPCVLGWTTNLNSAAKPYNFTIDFFAWVEATSPSGWLFKWHDIGIKYDSVTANVLFFYNSTDSVSSAETEADYGAKVVANAIHHYCIVYHVKSATLTQMYFYIDGVRIGAIDNVEIPNDPDSFVIGDPDSAVQVTYDEVKISHGVARWYPKDVQIGKVIGKAGDVWTVRESKNGALTGAKGQGTLTTIDQDPIQGTLTATTGKFGETPIIFGGADFTIDFWIKFESTRSYESGVFEIGNDTHSLGFHYHMNANAGKTATCIHGSLMSKQVQTAYDLDQFLYFVFTYSHSKKEFQAYCNGTAMMNKPRTVTIDESVFQLIIGRFNGRGGPAGYFKGVIENLRITVGKILSATDAYTQPYDITKEPTTTVDGVRQYLYTKALFDSDALTGTTGAAAGEDGADVNNPYRDFQVPSEPYSNVVGTSNSWMKRDYYIPLHIHFDDNVYTVIPYYPVQKDIPVYQAGRTESPVWSYYDTTKMTIGGALSGSLPGDYYATFTPLPGYVWRNGSVQPKRVIWSIKRQASPDIPEQETPLIYNGTTQAVNLTKYDSDMISITGQIEAVNANTESNPCYYVIATPKTGYAWPSGLTTPQTIPWFIRPQPVSRPAVTSSDAFVYNGFPQGLKAVYDIDLINVTGNSETAANASGSGRHKTLDRDLTDEEKYHAVFALKDKKNYCWQDDEEGEPDQEDIIFSWIIKRLQVIKPSFFNGSKIYSGSEQGPDILPSTWNTSIYQVTNHRGTEAKGYSATANLLDTDNYEWTDGTTGTVLYNWVISQVSGDISLSPYTLILKADQAHATPQGEITVTRLGTGAISCSAHVAVRTEIYGNKITVFGLKDTYGQEISLTVSVAASSNYTSAETKFNVQVIRGLNAFSWEEIADMAQKNVLLDYAYIGESKALPSMSYISENRYIPSSAIAGEQLSKERAVLVAVNHNAEVEGSGKATFLLYNMLNDSNVEQYMSLFLTDTAFNETNTTANGWLGSDIRKRITTLEKLFDYTNSFPNDLMSAIIPVIKWQDNIGDSVNKTNCVTPTLEYLTVPSEKEITGTVTLANKAEDLWQQQYGYFKNYPQVLRRKIYNHGAYDVADGFFLRSVAAVSLTTNKSVIHVNNIGAVTTCSVYQQTSALVPMFTVSEKKEDSLFIPDIDTCYEALLHCNDSDITDVCSNTYERINTPDIWDPDRNIHPVLSDTIVKFGNAAIFTDGVLDRIISRRTVTLGPGSCTIDFWVNIQTAKHGGVLFQLYSSKAQLRVKMTVENRKTYLCCECLDKQDFHSTATNLTWLSQKSAEISLSVWHHVSVVCYGSRSKTYFGVDGNVTCPGMDFVLPRYQYDVCIGGEMHDTRVCVNCLFDEIRILNGDAQFTISESVDTNIAGSRVQSFDPPTSVYLGTENAVKDQRTKAIKKTLNNTNSRLTFNVAEHDGFLEVMSTDPTVVSAYIDKSTAGSVVEENVIIEGHQPGTARIVIWTKDTDTTYGSLRNIDITCEANVPYKALNACTPEDIKHITKTGGALSAWQLGDQTASIHLESANVGGTALIKDVKATLIGIDHNRKLETNGFPAAHFMLEGLGRTFTVTAESEGWKGSNARSLLCQQIYEALPKVWRDVIVPCTKYTDNDTTSVTDSNVISATEDKIWLLSNYEVTGTVVDTTGTVNPFEYEKQQQYKYFETAAVPSSWLRTFNVENRTFVKKGDDINFCFVISDYSGAQKLTEEQGMFSVNNNVLYDGSKHDPIEEHIITYSNGGPVETQFYSVNGDINQSTVGDYVIRISPAAGYVWYDGTDGEKQISWSITTVSEPLQLSTTSVKLYHKSPTALVTVTRANTSTLTYQIDNPSLVTVTVSGNNVTLEAKGTGRTSVTITSPASGSYGEQQGVILVSSSTIAAFNTLNPADIQTVVNLGQAPLAWDTGDCTKAIQISGYIAGQEIQGTYNAYILGFDHNQAVEGTNRLHLCFAKTNDSNKKAVAFCEVKMSSVATPATTGWKGEPLRADLQDFFACLPEEWRQVIVPCVKTHNTPDVLKDVETVTDYVWLLSKPEIIKDDSMISRQYEYFANSNSTVRYKSLSLSTAVAWYLRSLKDATHYDAINNKGAAAAFLSNNVAAIVPCVAVGATKTFSSLSVTPTSLSVTVGGIPKFITVTRETGVTISAKSSDSTVATVSVSGNKVNVTGLKSGIAIVTVQAQENDTFSFNCVQVPVTVGEIVKSDAILSLSDTTINISVNSSAVFYTSATGGTITDVRSSNVAIATVTKVNDATYSVLGKAEGQVTVTVTVTGDSTHNNVTGYVTVNVNTSPTINRIPSDITIDGDSDKIFTYDGTEKDITTKLTGYNASYINIVGGTSKATNHSDTGNYIVSLAPKAGYEWNEGGTAIKQFEWNIAQASGILSGTTNLSLIKNKTTTQTFTYTITSGSVLSVKSNNNSSLVTTTVNSNQVTFTSSCTSDKTVTIVLQTKATLNYKAVSLTVTVVVKTADLTVITAAVPSINSSSYVTYNASKSYTYSDIISKITNFNSTYHNISAITSEISGSVIKTGNDITTVSIKNADTYTISVIPASGYCWNAQNDVSAKNLTFVIKRKTLTASQAAVTGPDILTSQFTTSYTPLASQFTYSTDYLVFNNAEAGSSVGTHKAYFSPTANYCWSDNTYSSKEYSWTISQAPVIVAIPKPSYILYDDEPNVQYGYEYDGTEQGFDDPNTQITNYPATAIAEDKVMVTAENYLAEEYSETNQVTKDYTKSDTVVRYTATEAGSYTLIFTLAEGEKWNDNTTEPVKITYVIPRCTITLPELAQDTFKVEPASFNKTTCLCQSYATHTPALKDYDSASITVSNRVSKSKPGSYYVKVTPTKNYKWADTCAEGQAFATKQLNWKIEPGDPAIQVNGELITELTPTISLTSDLYSCSFDITGSTGTIDSIQNSIYYGIKVADPVSSKRTVTFTGLKEGNNLSAVLKVNALVVDGITMFNKGEIPITYSLEIIPETDSNRRPRTFVRNFIKYLTWDFDHSQSLLNNLNSALSRVTNENITTFEDVVKAIAFSARQIHKDTSTMTSQQQVDYLNETLIPHLNTLCGINLGNTRYYVDSEGFVDLQNLDVNQDGGALKGSDIGSSTTTVSDADLISQSYPSVLEAYPSPVTQEIYYYDPYQKRRTEDLGLSVTYPEQSSLNDLQRKLVRMAHTWWLPQSLYMIRDLTGMSFNNPQVREGNVQYEVRNATTNAKSRTSQLYHFNLRTTNLGFTTLGEDVQAAVHFYNCEPLGENEKLTDKPISDLQYWYLYFSIQLDSATFDTMDVNENDEVVGGLYGQIKGDTLVLHELVHAVMFTSVPIVNIQYNTMPPWFAEGFAELLRGIDTTRYYDLIVLLNNPDALIPIYNLQTYDSNRGEFRYAYTLGYMMFRYLIKKYREGDFETSS